MTGSRRKIRRRNPARHNADGLKDMTDPIQKALGAHIEALNDAVEAAHEDRLTDVAALSRDLQRLEAQILRLRGEDAQAVQPVVSETIAALDRLAAAIESYKERLTFLLNP